MFNMTSLRRISSVALSIGVLSLAGCASTGYNSADTPGMSDPFEPANRAVLSFNTAVNDAIIYPAVDGYRAVVPEEGRQGVDNFVTNLKAPLHFANELLQADFEGAGQVFLRTAVNTLVGFGGIFDIASSEGYEHEGEDFGQTLAVWGVDEGPYLVLPFLGPSSMRDGTGLAVEALADPLRIYAMDVDKDHWHYTRIGVSGFNEHNNTKDILEELEKGSVDFYATLRSSYYQKRQADIRDHKSTGDDGAEEDLMEFPDYEDY